MQSRPVMPGLMPNHALQRTLAQTPIQLSLNTTNSNNHTRAAKVQVGALLTSIFIIAVCGLIYEFIIATLSSYLLGDSVMQFSLTIGFFLSAMGVGS